MSFSQWQHARHSCANRGIRITFHFTPKHASWIQQIEIWFSILVRKLLRRGNFTSKEHLQQRIESFINLLQCHHGETLPAGP